MKKVVKLLLILIILYFIGQFIFWCFKTKHDINYELKFDDKKYVVNEIFKHDKYYIKVSLGEEYFSYILDNVYHKDKEIVKNISYYEKDNLKCIDINLENSYVSCFKDGNSYSSYYFLEELSDFALQEEESFKTKNLDLSKVYVDNVLDDNYIYIWNYNGFYKVSDELSVIDVFSNDVYNNELGVLVDKYYVTLNYDDKYEYNSIYIYNIVNDRKKVINLKDSISKNCYINGIVDGKIYLFDVDTLVQYEINPKNKKIREVGNKKLGALFYDDSFKTLDIYEFKNEKKIFGNNNGYVFYKDLDNFSYYLDNDNNFYMYNKETKVETILFNMKINNINILDNIIYFVSDNILYYYEIGSVIKPVVIYDELRFNPFNRVFVYKK